MDNIPESVLSRLKIFEGNKKIASQYPQLSLVEKATIHASSIKFTECAFGNRGVVASFHYIFRC